MYYSNMDVCDNATISSNALGNSSNHVCVTTISASNREAAGVQTAHRQDDAHRFYSCWAGPCSQRLLWGPVVLLRGYKLAGV